MSLKSSLEKPLAVVLIISVIIPVVRFVYAAAPNPGHTWSEIGDIAVTVAQGGTGLAAMATGGILYASSTNTFSRLAPSAANFVLRSTAANALEFAALVAADIPSLDVAKITTGIFGSARGGTGNGFTLFSGPTTSEKTFTLPNATATILTDNADVTVAQGGTGLSTLTLNNVILGNGTSSPTFVAPSTSGNVLTSNGTTWTSAAPSGGGGSNALLDGTSHTDTIADAVIYGDIIVGNATPKWAALPMGSSSQVLAVSGDGTTVGWSDFAPSKRPEFYYTSREVVVQKNGWVATMTTVGGVAPTLTATASSVDASDGAWLQSTTTAVSANPSGIVSAFAVWRRDWTPQYLTKIKTDTAAITSIRYWIGMFSASPDLIARGTGTISLAAFSYDTGIDGTAFWRTVTSWSVANTFTTTTTSVAIAANTAYDLKILCDSGSCFFYINSVLVATHTTNLPPVATSLWYGNRVTTLTTVAKNLRTSYIALRYVN